MPVERLAPGETVGAARGEPVVCIPVYGGGELFSRCLASVVRHTPPAVRVLVADDATPGDEVDRLLEPADRPLYLLRQPRNVGFPANANAAMAAAAPGDPVLLNSDCAVAAGWLDGLRAAAYSDTNVATATALTNNGTIVSVPDRNRPSDGPPRGMSLDEAAAAVRERALHLRPRLPTAIGHCTYIRRAALELVGDFDESFSPGYGEEVDFSQRCIARGLKHAAADEVYVFHAGGAALGDEALRASNEREIERRYPYYASAVRAAATDQHGPLARAVGAARRALVGTSVTIDATALGAATSGTEVTTLELVNALAREEVRLRVVVSRAASPQVHDLLERLDVERAFLDEVDVGVAATDVVHRPSQAGDPKDLARLHRLGERIVVTQQDLIGYANPAYFDSFEAWDEHRTVTRQALAFADRVVFISEHGRREALAEDLVEAERGRVVTPGVDHELVAESSRAPAAAAELAERDLVLCLGADYQHKNLDFAGRVVAELRTRHGWDGTLVVAGPRGFGGEPGGDGVVALGPVSEAEKAWLLERAVLTLYPTVHEGFGLIPFESARAGTPCLFAPQASLGELLPDAAAIDP